MCQKIGTVLLALHGIKMERPFALRSVLLPFSVPFITLHSVYNILRSVSTCVPGFFRRVYKSQFGELWLHVYRTLYCRSATGLPAARPFASRVMAYSKYTKQHIVFHHSQGLKPGEISRILAKEGITAGRRARFHWATIQPCRLSIEK